LNSRSSDVSMFVVDPEAGCVRGSDVVGTARFRLPERAGVPPGLVTRRSTRRLKNAMSGPMKYPSVASGSSLSTPRGANGPAVRWPGRSANGATTIGPPPRTLDFPMAEPGGCWKSPAPLDMLEPTYRAVAPPPKPGQAQEFG